MKIGIDVLLTIIFAILKLTGVFQISWFLVFLPVIVGMALMVLFLLVVGIVAVKAKDVRIKNDGGLK